MARAMYAYVVFFTLLVVANCKLNCKPGTGYYATKQVVTESLLCEKSVVTQSACEARIRRLTHSAETIVNEVDSPQYPYGCVYFRSERRGIFNKYKSNTKCSTNHPCVCDDVCSPCHRNQYSDGGDTQCFECPRDKPYSLPRSEHCTKNPYNVFCEEGEGLLQEGKIYDRREGYCEDILTMKQCKALSGQLHRTFASGHYVRGPHGCSMHGDNFYFNEVHTVDQCSKEFPCKCSKRSCGVCPDGSHPEQHPAFGYECKECPKNYFSIGGKTCQPCEDGKNTAGKMGQSHCLGVTAEVKKMFDQIQAGLEKQKEITNDLSLKSSRLWQKEQIRLDHDKMMERRKSRDAAMESSSCKHDQMSETIIFPAVEVSEEIEKLESTTCLNTNRDEMLASVCSFTSDLDDIFQTESIELSAKSFFPNICCKERRASKLLVCSDPEGKIKRENIVPFALSQGGEYSPHNLYAEVTDSIKYNGYLHNGMKSLIDSLQFDEEIKGYIDRVFKDVSLCGPRLLDDPDSEAKLCQLLLPYKHTMHRFLQLIRHGIYNDSKGNHLRQALPNKVFLETVERSMVQRGKASGRLGKLDVQSMLNMKPLKNPGEKKCAGGSQFVSSELNKMKRNFCDGYSHVDLKDKRIKNVALHFLREEDIVSNNREMERLIENFRFQVVDTSCPSPLLTAKSISIQAVRADPLQEEKVWVAIAKLDSESDDGYLQSELPFCQQKDYLIGAKIQIKLYVDESNCCNGMRDYDECMRLHDTVLVKNTVQRKLKCSGRLREKIDGDGRHYVKTIDVTGTKFQVNGRIIKRRRLLQGRFGRC